MRLIIFTLLLLGLFGCEQSPPPQTTATAELPKAAPSGSGLFHQTYEPFTFELPSEALASWRSADVEKPALLLFSYDPLLKPIDSRLSENARQLATSGTAEELRRHGSYNVAEPLILPTQAVSAAIDAGLISKLYWVFPSKVPSEQLDLVKFRTQMVEQGLLSEADSATLNLNAGVFSGMVRGIPFEAIHYQQLRAITGPLLLHVDTSFFRGLYDNEIKSPLYGLLRTTVDSLRALNLQPLATSLSYSTLEGANALDVRFLLENFAQMISDPSILDGDMPKDWQTRGEALYAGDMYSESKRIELALQLVSQAPQSPAAHYDRFQALFLSKKVDEGLQSLHDAVRLDPGYGAAYVQLAQMAIDDQNIETAVDLLGRAETLFPENPFITLQKAHLLVFLKDEAAARAHLDRLPADWSPLFHAKIPGVIAELRQQLAAAKEEKPRG